jgi:hypothetical protein
VLPDPNGEPDETVSFALINPSPGLLISRSPGTLTILNDD